MIKSQRYFDNIEGVSCFKGRGLSTKSVCVMGSIHGNERIGAAVLERLGGELSSMELQSDIYLVLGNPEAYRRDVRFVDTDMNRLFGIGMEGHLPGNNVEEKRVAEIAPVLAASDYLLDLHSTIKPSVPFVYCEPNVRHMVLAELMGVRYVVSAADDFRPADLVGSADNFVDRNGGLGITFESGWREDGAGVDDVLFRAKLFLQKVGACDFGLVEPEKVESKRLIIYNHVVPQSTAFVFARDFVNFSMVMAGEIIGNDGGTEVRAERDSFIIFPKKDIQKGKVACYLAHIA